SMKIPAAASAAETDAMIARIEQVAVSTPRRRMKSHLINVLKSKHMLGLGGRQMLPSPFTIG
ncbi:MAG TPA: hypothetical protein VKT70_09485, partial [Stellaceae bacterium]|nr:hypothetical protein [Stellaceae bacterium]